MWSVRPANRRSRSSATLGVNAIAFRPGGDEVATAASDGTARVWRATRGEQAIVDIGQPAQLVLRGDGYT